MSLTDLSRMIRPWYRGADPFDGCHIYADCEWLAEEGDPREGVGWLDPDSDMCAECRRRYDPDTYGKWADEWDWADDDF